MAELSDLERIRFEKLRLLQEAGMEPYPARAHRTHFTLEAIAAFEDASEADVVTATIVGRLRSIRSMGKVVFVHVEDEQGRLQLFIRLDEVGEESLSLFKSAFDLGDYIQAEGTMFRTNAGEVSLKVESFKIL